MVEHFFDEPRFSFLTAHVSSVSHRRLDIKHTALLSMCPDQLPVYPCFPTPQELRVHHRDGGVQPAAERARGDAVLHDPGLHPGPVGLCVHHKPARLAPVFSVHESGD